MVRTSAAASSLSVIELSFTWQLVSEKSVPIMRGKIGVIKCGKKLFLPKVARGIEASAEGAIRPNQGAGNVE